jgi:serine/threonine-protein kinase SRPK3
MSSIQTSKKHILLPADLSVLTQFEEGELAEPSTVKEVAGGGVIYLSREMGFPKAFGAPVLCDFGSAVSLDDGLEHREDIQPDIYRAREVIWISRGLTAWISGMWDVW